MKWKKVKKMFPSGSIIVNEDLSIKELENSEYTTVSTTENHLGRSMIHRQDQLIWKSDGTFTRTNIYNVYDSICPPEEDSCLSIYGAKMIEDYLNNKLETFYYIEEK